MEKRLPTQRLTKLTNEAGIVLENEIVAGELSQEPFQPQGAQPTQDAGKLEWRNAADAEHIDGLGIVAKHQRTALHGAPPQALFAERELPVVESQPCVGVE